jgi:hypothetical protein
MQMGNWPGMLGHLGTWAQNRLDDLKTTELAMYAYDEGTGVDRRSRLLVARELGLLDVVEAVAEPAETGPGPEVWKTTGDLHPWPVVRGVQMSYSQTSGRRAPQLRVFLEHPAFDQTIEWPDDNPLLTALQEFGATCMRQALPANVLAA